MIPKPLDREGMLGVVACGQKSHSSTHLVQEACSNVLWGVTSLFNS